MRLALFFLLLTASAAGAWEFTPGLPCRLTHQTPQVQVALTYDPTQPLYSITLTQQTPWPEAAVFTLQFTGPAGLTISSSRHRFSDNGRAVTVTDNGFGNVLNGLQFNDTVTVLLGEDVLSIPLTGASNPVDRFRRCEATAGA